MHYLFLPYAFLSAIFLVHFADRERPLARTAAGFVAFFSICLCIFALAQRRLEGDAFNYYLQFLQLKNVTFSTVIFDRSDPLFLGMSWLVRNVTSSEDIYFLSITAVYVGLFVVAIRKAVGSIDSALVLIGYTMFPFFVAYGVTAIRQGIAMAFILLSIVSMRSHERKAWLYLAMAPLAHSGAGLAVGAIVGHAIIWRLRLSTQQRLWTAVSIFACAVGLSFFGLNRNFVSMIPDYLDISDKRMLFFDDRLARRLSYRTGFRWDFTIFSMIPIITHLSVPRPTSQQARDENAWLLGLYLLLNSLYHLFSVAVFSDRFGGFSWFLIPLIVFFQVRNSGDKQLMFWYSGGIVALNLASLQAYSGTYLAAPPWWP